VIHGTILAFAQWPTWPTLAGCRRLGGIARTALARDQAAHYGKPLFIADLVVAAVGDRAAAWLGAQRATFRARLFLLRR
jgi:hypothetical protein